MLSGSVALLSDLIHNAGDALTAIPIGIAFFLKSARGERWAGRAVVLAIAISAAVALVASIQRLIEPRDLTHLWALAIAGLVGVAGNEAAAVVRLRAGRRLRSPALVADGHHARIDGLVSFGVVASAARRGARRAGGRPVDRPGDLAADPPDHLAGVGDRPVRRTGLALLAGLFLAGLALRPPIVGVGPLIPAIQDDLDISHAVAGLLGTIPVLCMGVFALPAPALTRRYGSRLAIAACLALIGGFGVARAAAPGAAGVIALTFGVGLGLGFAQALMPVAVKERFADRPAFVTGIYVLGINIGSAISSALAVPIANAAGSWRWSLAAFSIMTCALVARLVVADAPRGAAPARRGHARSAAVA